METSEVRNPFALLVHPDLVVKAMESSERLNQLHSRICRPLDRTGEHPAGPARDDEAESEDASSPLTGV